jgi:putative transposase
MERLPYPTDLTNDEGRWLDPLLPVPAKPGRPRKDPLRELLHALSSVLRTGCQGRALPHDLPKWQTASHDLRLWRNAGPWARVHERVRERVRGALGRAAQPSAGLSDRHSGKTAGVGGERGYEGAKRINGRKRHLLVAPQGVVLRVTGPPAAIRDRAGVPLRLPPGEGQAPFPRLSHVWLDAGYSGAGRGKDGSETPLRIEMAGLKNTTGCI